MQRIVICLFLISGMFACKNAEINHPDFDYTTGYFPYQYPVRTLVLGDDIYDNSNDNAHKFLISVAMGGVYENKLDRTFNFRLDESLCENAYFEGSKNPILPLPTNYYQLSSDQTILIPKGKVNGGIEVQLADAFFDDPKAITTGYVIPLVLTESTDVDSILGGNSNLVTPDRRILEDWNILPKDFTMFAVKYINEYHGNYFHYGESFVSDPEGNRLDEQTYKAAYVEINNVKLLTTTARRQVVFTTNLQSDVMKGNLNLILSFDGDQCTVTSDHAELTVTGTGQFKKGAFEWGNKARNGITLAYTVSDGTNTYTAKDELVVRDRAVVMELFSPVIDK